MLSHIPPSRERIARLELLLGEELTKKLRARTPKIAYYYRAPESYFSDHERDIDPLELLEDFYANFDTNRVNRFVEQVANSVHTFYRMATLVYLGFRNELSRNNAIELLEKMPIKDATLLFGAVLGTRTIDPNAGKGEHCSYAPTAEELIRYVGGVDKFVDGGKKALEIYNLLEKRRMYPSTLNWREFVKDPSSQNKNRLLSW